MAYCHGQAPGGAKVPDQWPVQFADLNACKGDAELNHDGN